MSASLPVDLRPLLCEHCHETIERDPRRFIFVVARKSATLRLADPAQTSGFTEVDIHAGNSPHIATPFVCSFQRADFIVSDDELAFGSMVCIKKWLLDWVNSVVSLGKEAGRA